MLLDGRLRSESRFSSLQQKIRRGDYIVSARFPCYQLDGAIVYRS